MKMWKAKFVTIFLIVFSSCYVKNEEKEVSAKRENKPEVVGKDPVTKEVFKKESFTVSCGSGCAMTYDVLDKNIAGSLQTIKFKVTMYVNEEVAEEYFESYEFKCESGSIQSISIVGQEKNLLEDNESLIKQDLKEIGERVCASKN